MVGIQLSWWLGDGANGIVIATYYSDQHSGQHSDQHQKNTATSNAIAVLLSESAGALLLRVTPTVFEVGVVSRSIALGACHGRQAIRRDNMNKSWGPRKYEIAKLVHIPPISPWFMVLLSIVTKGLKKQLITFGGPTLKVSTQKSQQKHV